ncbi:ribonuclease P protein component [Weeksellaceae bacterium A-14]
MKNTYPRHEKLKQKKEIALLFEKGKWKSCGRLRIISSSVSDGEQGKFAVSVSKRYFKKSVDRNRIKRLMRECYRLHKDEFYAVFGSSSHNMMFWTSPTKPNSLTEVEEEFRKLCLPKK